MNSYLELLLLLFLTADSNNLTHSTELHLINKSSHFQLFDDMKPLLNEILTRQTWLCATEAWSEKG